MLIVSTGAVGLLIVQRGSTEEYRYGSWWSVWWTGTYSIVLSKASFFHRQYLDLYTNNMLPSIRKYVDENRCTTHTIVVHHFSKLPICLQFSMDLTIFSTMTLLQEL